MAQYLSNHDPKESYLSPAVDHDTMEFKVYVAALRSGQNVKYLTCPMPPDGQYGSEHYDNHVISGNFNHFGCIVGIDNEGDYSKFWREMEKLEE